MPRCSFVFAVCLLGSVLLTLPALAQNPAAAEALFEQARAAMAAGNYDIACARLRDSDRLDPAVGTRFNLADCEDRRGRVATSWSLFRSVLSELGAEDDRRPIAAQRAKALESRLPYLTLRRVADTPAAPRMRLDGVELGEASLGVALPLDPGPHELVLLAEGKEERRSFTLAEGQRTDLPVHFARAAAPDPAVSDTGTRRAVAYVVGGVGVVGALTGIVAGIVTLGKKSTANAHCNDALRLCDETGRDANQSGRTFGVVSGVGFAVGVVGLATGAYLWLTSPSPAPAKSGVAKRGRVSVDPKVGLVAGTGFVSVTGSF